MSKRVGDGSGPTGKKKRQKVPKHRQEKESTSVQPSATEFAKSPNKALTVLPRLIGGSFSSEVLRSLVSPDNRFILLLNADEDCLHVYRCPEGDLYCSFDLTSCAESSDQSTKQVFHFQDIVLSPANPAQEVICVSEEGLLVLYNYRRGGAPLARWQLNFQKKANQRDDAPWGTLIRSRLCGLFTTKPPGSDSLSTYIDSYALISSEYVRGEKTAGKSGSVLQNGGDRETKSETQIICDLCEITGVRFTPVRRNDPPSETRNSSVKRTTLRDVSCEPARTSFHNSGELIASVVRNELQVFFRADASFRRHMIQLQRDTELVCVVCHPTQLCVATGDSHGKILLWYGLDNCATASRSVLHWHSSSVGALVFSPEGSYLWSGGQESTLVQWSLVEMGHKDYLPRLPEKIVRLTSSSGRKEGIIAVHHADNAVTLVGLQRNVIGRIDSISKPLRTANVSSRPLPPLITRDPRSGCIVMRGPAGQLEFCDPVRRKINHTYDVVRQNVVSCGASDWHSVNTEIDAVAFQLGNGHCQWMATSESLLSRHLGLTASLKFWRFDADSNKYVLHTIIIDPHDGQNVVSVTFSPRTTTTAEGGDLRGELTEANAVTISQNQFKLWSVIFDPSSGKMTWICVGSGRSEDVPVRRKISMDAEEENFLVPRCAAFAQSRDLLAVSFDQFITFWSTRILLKKKRTAPLSQGDGIVKSLAVISIEQQTAEQILLSCSSRSICLWDLKQFSLMQKLDLTIPPIQCCIQLDVFSPYVICCGGNKVVILNVAKLLNHPDGSLETTDSTLVYQCDIPFRSADEVTACATYRKPSSGTPAEQNGEASSPAISEERWLDDWRPVLLSSKGQLWIIAPDIEISRKLPVIEKDEKESAYEEWMGRLAVVREATESDQTSTAKNIRTKSNALHQILDAPAHTMAPVKFCMTQLLDSLLKGPEDATDTGDRPAALDFSLHIDVEQEDDEGDYVRRKSETVAVAESVEEDDEADEPGKSWDWSFVKSSLIQIPTSRQGDRGGRVTASVLYRELKAS